MRSRTTILALTLAAAVATASCAGAAASPRAADPAAAPAAAADATLAAPEAPAAEAIALADGELTDAEAEGLVFMREEEKLARDVYLAMYELWGLPVFDNIASAEQQHTDAVLGLIEAYGLDDPVADDTPGVFTNPDLAALYETLVARGSASLVDALTVGALIEDLDIADLRSWLERTDDPAVERVYSSLLAGSENHLRAFVGQLEERGSGYEPTYLTPDDVEGIMAAGGSGGPGGGGRGGRGNGRNH
ncbi:MAG: DUF2202 domain-containing protein [Actinobacteria bacterium]|nr:DUF2202 domain-containing protein [Actinomycetota bacterium]